MAEHSSSCSIEESREILKAMILREERYYQCPNYLSLDDYDNNDSRNKKPTNKQTTSSLQIIEEISNLVTDFRFACNDDANANANANANDDNNTIQSVSSILNNSTILRNIIGSSSTDENGKHKRDQKQKPWKCISPISSAVNLYEENGETPRSNLSNSQTKQQQQPQQRLCFNIRLSSHQTSCLSTWRHEMLHWACMLDDRDRFLDVNSTVLEVAFDILDRYIAAELSCGSSLSSSSPSSSSLHDNKLLPTIVRQRENFQLIAMVSIYIASKLSINHSQQHRHYRRNHNEQQYLNVPSLIKLSQGSYTENDITSTEQNILSVLNWHVHPPTIIEYCEIFLDLFPFHNNTLNYPNMCHQDKQKRMIHRRCKHIVTDIILDNTFFLNKHNSVIALAVVLSTTDAARGGGCINGVKDYGIDDVRRRRRSKRKKRGKQLGYCDTNNTLQRFLQNIQGVVNVDESELDSIIRQIECSYWKIK